MADKNWIQKADLKKGALKCRADHCQRDHPKDVVISRSRRRDSRDKRRKKVVSFKVKCY